MAAVVEEGVVKAVAMALDVAAAIKHVQDRPALRLGRFTVLHMDDIQVEAHERIRDTQ